MILTTNLLNTPVQIKNTEITGQIRAIAERNGYFVLVILANDGTFHEKHLEDVTALTLTHDNSGSYTVVLFWQAHEKIKAIKAVRSIIHLDLKAAKDFVEAQPRAIKVKEHISLEEAQGIRWALTHDNQMECEIRKEF